MDLTDPQQLHGYAYSRNNPITNSDPTGLRDECGSGSTWDTCDNSNPPAAGPCTGLWCNGQPNNNIGYNHWGRPVEHWRTVGEDEPESRWSRFTGWVGAQRRNATEKVQHKVTSVAQWINDNRTELASAAGHLVEIEAGIVIAELGAGLAGGGLILDFTGVGAIVGVPANVAGIGLIAIGGGIAAHGGWGLGQDVKTMYSKKQSRRSGKERATDTPSWARGGQQKPGETADQAVERIFREHGKDVPPPNQRGPNSEYSKIKKNVTRK